MIYLVADHAGIEQKKIVKEACHELGYECMDLYPVTDLDDDYPLVATILAKQLLTDKESLGIALCGTGFGMCIALNRFSNIRAVWADTPEKTTIAREHNHANVLCLGAGYSGTKLEKKELKELFYTFATTQPSREARHLRRVSQLTDLAI